MKALLIASILLVVSLLSTAPILAQGGDPCPQHDATVQALRECVVHAAAEGHITNAGVTQSLLAKLDAAQAALDRGQSNVALNQLGAFIAEVEAQAGEHIAAEHAAHMEDHAQQVIQALSQ